MGTDKKPNRACFARLLVDLPGPILLIVAAFLISRNTMCTSWGRWHANFTATCKSTAACSDEMIKTMHAQALDKMKAYALDTLNARRNFEVLVDWTVRILPGRPFARSAFDKFWQTDGIQRAVALFTSMVNWQDGLLSRMPRELQDSELVQNAAEAARKRCTHVSL